MFNNLTNKFQGIFRNLTGRGILTESNIKESMEEIRTALLDADVNYDVASRFVQECATECLGTEVLKNVKPGQQVVKVVYDKLTALLGENSEPLQIAQGDPAVIMLCGLHGSGKTTTTAKLAKHLRDRYHKKVMLIACDVYRPAAIDQIEALGADLGFKVFSDRELKNVPQLAVNGINFAHESGMDVVILDTAGRLQIDEELVQELVEVKRRTNPNEILLVGDAALGQEAVSVAEHFDKALGITGIILTKLDGDARGGAALSMHSVTGKPIKFLTVGERPMDLEVFHPDRMASRILGMGDVLSLYEKAAEQIDAEEAKKLEERLLQNKFGFDDFLDQINKMRKMGGFMSLLKLLPGMGDLPPEMQGMADKDIKQIEAMINSMTKQERRNPEIINQSRRIRIAKGSAHTVQELNQFIKQFNQMKQLTAKLNESGLMKSAGGLSGLLNGLGGLFGGGGGAEMNQLMGEMMGGGMPRQAPPQMGGMGGMGGFRGPSQQQLKQQKKRLEQKKQAKKSKQKNRRK